MGRRVDGLRSRFLSLKDKMNELALFAGAGGGILGGKLLGWRTVCSVEIEPYAASVLCARQNDGILEAFPIWDNVCTFDGKPWRGIVDVISGGFPCQDISSAGKGAGITGERSGLWKEFARIIGEVRPNYVLVENSPILTSRGLGVVLGDLAALGYDAEWGVLGANATGMACIKRERIWILASSIEIGRDCLEQDIEKEPKEKYSESPSWRSCFPMDLLPIMERFDTNSSDGGSRNDDGLPEAMDRLAAVGNAQFPAVVRLAWNTLGS